MYCELFWVEFFFKGRSLKPLDQEVARRTVDLDCRFRPMPMPSLNNECLGQLNYYLNDLPLHVFFPKSYSTIETHLHKVYVEFTCLCIPILDSLALQLVQHS